MLQSFTIKLLTADQKFEEVSSIYQPDKELDITQEAVNHSSYKKHAKISEHSNIIKSQEVA